VWVSRMLSLIFPSTVIAISTWTKLRDAIESVLNISVFSTQPIKCKYRWTTNLNISSLHGQSSEHPYYVAIVIYVAMKNTEVGESRGACGDLNIIDTIH